MSTFRAFLPHFASGPVISGFGRGSKELGIATANFGVDVVNALPQEVETGVYFGWASVNGGDVHKMVMSVGWNPFYQNKQKSMETHIMHKYGADFYGKILRVCMLGYLRPETNFESLQALIDAINRDIKQAETFLDEPQYATYKSDPFFTGDDKRND